MQHFGLRMRPRDDAELRAERAGLLHHLAAFEGVGDGDEQAACRAEVGGGDDLGVRGIAGDGLDALRFQLGKPLIVVLDDEERHLLFGEALADDAADPAMADQHHMIVERRRADRLAGGAFLLRLDRFHLCFRLVAPCLKHVEPGEEQRIEQDGEDGAGEDEIAAALRQKPEIDAEPGEDEGELADLREADRDEQRGRGGIAEQADDGEGRERLAEQDDEQAWRARRADPR